MTRTRNRGFVAAVAAVALGCTSAGEGRSGEPAIGAEVQPDAEQANAERSGVEQATAEQPESKPADAAAARTLAELERRLQDAASVELTFLIDSEGAVDSHFVGDLAWRSDGVISLTAEGEFAGQPQQLELRGDAKTLEVLVAGESRWTGARPPALIEALTIGLTRQGLLHNLAVLSAGRPPEHADGGVSEWVEVVDPQLGPLEVLGPLEARPLEFGITVEDQPVGHATMWIAKVGVPVERRQTVDFPEGQMRVTERYTSVALVDE